MIDGNKLFEDWYKLNSVNIHKDFGALHYKYITGKAYVDALKRIINYVLDNNMVRGSENVDKLIKLRDSTHYPVEIN